MLRHTFGMQLVNAGCQITTIQALLGHKHLNTTMTYARVHDRTVAEDYFAAMAVVEKRLEGHSQRPSAPTPGSNGDLPATHDQPAHLLTLVAVLHTEPLSQSQQTVVTQLQQGLASLAESLNGTASQFDQIVNEQVVQSQA